MISHRTTARGILVLVLALLDPRGRSERRRAPDRSSSRCSATVTYSDDFGDAAAGGAHQGIDIMAPKRSLALAAEAGKVKFWTTLRDRRLHALPLRRERHGLLLHPPQQRPDREERQPRQVRRRDRVREGAEGRREGRRRPADRLRRRLGRRERDPPAPALRGAPGTRRGGRPVPVAAAGDAPALLRAARDAVHARAARDDRLGHRGRACSSGSPPSAPGRCASTSRS